MRACKAGGHSRCIVSRRFAVHPSAVLVQGEQEYRGSTDGVLEVRVAPSSRPLNSCLLRVEGNGSAWRVSDLPAMCGVIWI